MTQGKIERCRRTMKKRINPNRRRVRESPDNLNPPMCGTAGNLVKERTTRRGRRQNPGPRPLSEEVIRPEVYRECPHQQKPIIVPKALTTYNERPILNWKWNQ